MPNKRANTDAAACSGKGFGFRARHTGGAKGVKPKGRGMPTSTAPRVSPNAKSPAISRAIASNPWAGFTSSAGALHAAPACGPACAPGARPQRLHARASRKAFRNDSGVSSRGRCLHAASSFSGLSTPDRRCCPAQKSEPGPVLRLSCLEKRRPLHPGPARGRCVTGGARIAKRRSSVHRSHAADRSTSPLPSLNFDP